MVKRQSREVRLPAIGGIREIDLAAIREIFRESANSARPESARLAEIREVADALSECGLASRKLAGDLYSLSQEAPAEPEHVRSALDAAVRLARGLNAVMVAIGLSDADSLSWIAGITTTLMS